MGCVGLCVRCAYVIVYVRRGGGGWVGGRERSKRVKCKHGGILILLVRFMIFRFLHFIIFVSLIIVYHCVKIEYFIILLTCISNQ